MATATPDTLGDVLSQLITSAADAAAAQPAKLAEVFDQAGRTLGDVVEQATDLPSQALDTLKSLVDPPDWWSLLLFVLVQVAKLDPHLSVGTASPLGWSRTVTVTYTVDPGPPVQSVTVGLALTDPGTTHGVTLDATGPVTVSPLGTGGPLVVSIATTAELHWRIPFAGPPLTLPDQAAVLDATISWDPHIAVGDAVAGLTIGPAGAVVHLDSTPGNPLWGLKLGIGTPPATPGADAHVDLGQALGALGSIVHIGAIDERYSPALVLAPGTPPQFSLGEGA